MTFILNILHKDMSVLAADKRAIADWSTSPNSDMAAGTGGRHVVDDYEKITFNPTRTLALSIAGHTRDHPYLPSLKTSAGIDEVLWKIRNHMADSLRVHDRPGLSKLTSFTRNEGIASFFDEAVGTHFSCKYAFTPVQSHFQLYRGSDQAQVLYAGSGSRPFEQEIGQAGIDAFVSSTIAHFTPESCIAWMNEAYRTVSAIDHGTGPEPAMVVSTSSSPKFRSW